MRYFLDTEYDGFGGALLSLALVPEDGGEEFYVVLRHDRPLTDWVEQHVAPFFDMVPAALRTPPLDRAEAAEALAQWLGGDPEIEIVADWPEDFAQLMMLLVIGPGRMAAVPPLRLTLVPMANFSTAAASAVPHNALHDARALRDHLLSL